MTRIPRFVHHREQHCLCAHQRWDQTNTTVITTPTQQQQQRQQQQTTTRLTPRPGPPQQSWTSLSGSGISLSHLRPQEARSTDGEMFKTKKPTTKTSGSTGTTARSPRHPQAQQHPYSSSAFHEGNRWMGGSVGCSVFEEHHRAGIERERERTNQREGQKYDNHMLAIWLSGAANVTRT